MSETPLAKSKKRLALFLDGTWNTVSDNTNVWRLRSLIAEAGADGLKQVAYYSTGLGTKFGERIRGGMFGRGIDTAITGAYEWLVDKYDPDDEIFIFGFSRGSYTARSLSGFVSKCGLLRRGAPLGVNQLYMRYRRDQEKTIRDLLKVKEDALSTLSPEETWIRRYCMAVPIKFIGVFDTVGALGVPLPWLRKLRGTAYPFLNTGLRQNNEFAFHALAIDEHRRQFLPTLWTNKGAIGATPRTIDKTEQRWFVGAHANVGGGCFNDALAELPFKWLQQKAMKLGLGFSDYSEVNVDVAKAGISDSFSEFLNGWYPLLRLWSRYHREIGVAPKHEGEGVSTINETIDGSVFKRWKADPAYRPRSLQKWAEVHKVDPESILSSVRVDNPSTSVPDW